MERSLCIICDTRLDFHEGHGEWSTSGCPRCGRFETTEDFEMEWGADGRVESPELVGSISGWLRQRRNYRLTADDVAALRNLRPLPVGEKCELLLTRLARLHPTPGKRFDLQCDAPEILGICWASGVGEVEYLAADYLADEKHFLVLGASRHLSNNALTRLRINPAGWSFLQALKRPEIRSDEGFVAMWFDPSMEALRRSGFEVGIAEAGYEPKIMLTHEHANRIDDEILALIRRARFVVADFTGSRGGVYFEAGFALGLGRPVVWTCNEQTLKRGELHFDVNHYNFLLWADGAYEDFAKRLTFRIESIVGRGSMSSSRRSGPSAGSHRG